MTTTTAGGEKFPEPKNVVCLIRKPAGRPCFDWNDSALVEWLSRAIQLQDAHVNDNNLTSWFKYDAIDHRDSFELRVLMAMYGVRTPQKNSKSAPFSPLATYNRAERTAARKLLKTLVEKSQDKRNVRMNIIYISTATKVEKDAKHEFYASEIPLFVVEGENNQRVYIEKEGRTYVSIEDYRDNNKLPKGPMIYPANGTYTPGDKNKVVLHVAETPSASFLSRLDAIVTTVATVSGMVFSVAGVVTYFAPSLLGATAAAVIKTGSFVLTGFSIFKSCTNIFDKLAHDESIRTDVFVLISAYLSFYSGRIRMQAAEYAREGKTIAELMEKIGTFKSALFTLSNVVIVISSCASILSAMSDFFKKRERSWMDYYQLSMGMFMFLNVVTKPITLKGVFESEQMAHLRRIEEKLESDEAKKQMKKMVGQNETSDEKAYMIRNVNQIKNPTEFFELASKTATDVKFTADGMVFNGNIQMSPLMYNQIGTTFFSEKIDQISKLSPGEMFEGDVPEGKRAEFKKGMEEVKKLPPEEQKEATKKLIGDLRGGELSERESQEFDAKYDKEKSDIKSSINKLVDEFGEGTTPEQKADFDKLKELNQKRADGVTLNPDEQRELDEQMAKCARHRKEYFMSSSKATGDLSNDVEREKFRERVKTFTSAQNEGLCYRIDVENAQKKLMEATCRTDFNNAMVGGKNIFANMTTSDYDRLNRATNTPEKAKLVDAAIEIANDKDFKGKITSPSDFAALVETLGNDKEFMSSPNPQEALVAFRDRLNSLVDDVAKLDDGVKSKWGSTLAMACDYKNNMTNFVDDEKPISAERYFEFQEKVLLNSGNAVGGHFSQSGVWLNQYARSFGTRVCVGTTFGPDATRVSTSVTRSANVERDLEKAKVIKEQAVEIFEEAENQKEEISNGEYLAKSNEAQQLYNQARQIENNANASQTPIDVYKSIAQHQPTGNQAAQSSGYAGQTSFQGNYQSASQNSQSVSQNTQSSQYGQFSDRIPDPYLIMHPPNIEPDKPLSCVCEQKSLSVLYFNARSINPEARTRNMAAKFEKIKNMIDKNKPDIVAIVETWLRARHDNQDVINRLGLDDYTIFRRDRETSNFGIAFLVPNQPIENPYADRKGGGILVAFRHEKTSDSSENTNQENVRFASNAKISFRHMHDDGEDYFDSIMNFELTQTITCPGCRVSSSKLKYGLSVIYRRPGKFKDGETNDEWKTYLDEFDNRLKHMNDYFSNIGWSGYVFVGDFNKENTSREVEYMCSGMVSMTTEEPTHKDGGNIDLVCADDDNMISELYNLGRVSDHAALRFRLQLGRDLPEGEKTCPSRRCI